MTTIKPWRLSIGVHRGTIASRDANSVEHHFGDPTKPLTSLEEVKATAQEWANNYRSLGLDIWFANAIAPDGTVINSIL